MRRFERMVAPLALVMALTGAAVAGPMPLELIGTWTDQPVCGPKTRKMIFTADTITVVQEDGRRKVVQIDTSGRADDRLEIRATKIISGEEADSPTGHIGDVLVVRHQNGEIHLIGHTQDGEIRDEPGGPVLHRCK